MTDLRACVTELGAKLGISIVDVRGDAAYVLVRGVRAKGYRFGYRDSLRAAVQKLAPDAVVDIVLDDR